MQIGKPVRTIVVEPLELLVEQPNGEPEPELTRSPEPPGASNTAVRAFFPFVSGVGSEEVNWFDAKLRSRGLTFGILVTTLGITGQAADLTAAHAIVAAALREGRRLVVLTTDELLATASTEDLVRLIKRKLCDLAVKGTVA
jgi:hypothetical protein